MSNKRYAIVKSYERYFKRYDSVFREFKECGLYQRKFKEDFEMPRKITAWACKFKCGHRINSSKKAIEWHEKTCFLNPSRKACKTCKFWHFEDDSPDCTESHLDMNDYATYNCEYWKSK